MWVTGRRPINVREVGVSKTLDPAEGEGGQCGLSQEPQGWVVRAGLSRW